MSHMLLGIGACTISVGTEPAVVWAMADAGALPPVSESVVVINATSV